MAAVAGVIVALAIVVRAQDGAEAPLARAQQLVGDAGNFDSGRETGDTLVFAASELLTHARRCIADNGETPYCLAFRAAAAWSNVAGAKALTCRAPQRFALQRRVVAYFDRLEKLSPRVRDLPLPPTLPACD